MLINHPSGFGKTFIDSSTEPTPMPLKEIVEVAKHLSELIDQSYVMVAILVADNFPNSELMVCGDEDKVEFTLFCREKLLLTINDVGWNVEDDEFSSKWEDIKEGNPETVAERILQGFAQRGFSVFDPSGGIFTRKEIKFPLTKFDNWLK
jgi:hypothetical protein